MTREPRRAFPSPARAPANGGIRSSGYGRSRCARICGTHWSTKTWHKIELWTARHGIAIAEWQTTPIDPFFNVNTPKDVAQAEAIAAKYPDA